jgi:hypothetical protein
MPIQYAGGTNISATFHRGGSLRHSEQRRRAARARRLDESSVCRRARARQRRTFTITIASPGVITFNSHGFLGGERVILQTTGALPTGLSVNTVYFVKYINANTFSLALTLGGANINTTGSQSGTHTVNSESFLMSTAATSQTLADLRAAQGQPRKLHPGVD